MGINLPINSDHVVPSMLPWEIIWIYIYGDQICLPPTSVLRSLEHIWISGPLMPPTQGGESLVSGIDRCWVLHSDGSIVVLERVIGGCFSRCFHQILMFCIWKVANMFIELIFGWPRSSFLRKEICFLIFDEWCHHGSSFRILIKQCSTST